MLAKLKGIFALLRQEMYQGEKYDIRARTMKRCYLIFALILLFFVFFNNRPGFRVGQIVCGVLSVSFFVMGALITNTKYRLFCNYLITILTTAVLTLYTFEGTNEGFGILWSLLVPIAIIYFVGVLYGLAESLFLELVFIIAFYTPIRGQMLTGKYTEVFMTRYPILYMTCTIVIGAIMMQYHLISLKQTDSEKQLKNEVERQKQIAHRLEEANQEALRANQAKSTFLAQMSHEIRTPINAVLGMNEMILRESTEKGVREYAENAYNAGNALLSIINDILDISKIEAGKMEIVEADYDLSSLVSDCYLMTADRARKKGLELTVNCDEDLPSKLGGDMFHIRQVAVNFLTNAVKYTDEGSVKLSFSGEKRDGEFFLRISVKDTGIGLTEESKENLFESFQRFEIERNQFVEGTGLGLSICRQITELMNGRIEVESVYGQGSEFICTVPQKIVNETPIGKINPEHTAVRLSTEKGKILTAPDARVLVVDDIEMNLIVFSSLLKSSRMRIDTALSGKKCLELVKEHCYDIIFMDHMMPEMSGIETFERMKETEHKNKNTPVIMLTANAISGEKEKYLSQGFASYLTKPIQSDKLEETLIEFLPEEKIKYEKIGKTDETAKAVQSERFDVLKEIDCGFDLNKALGYCSGSEDFYAELLRDFANSNKLSELDEAFSKKDFESYERIIHTLKGSMRTFGFNAFGDIAEGLQRAAAERNEKYIEENHGKAAQMLSGIIGCAEKI